MIMITNIKIITSCHMSHKTKEGNKDGIRLTMAEEIGLRKEEEIRMTVIMTFLMQEGDHHFHLKLEDQEIEMVD